MSRFLRWQRYRMATAPRVSTDLSVCFDSTCSSLVADLLFRTTLGTSKAKSTPAAALKSSWPALKAAQIDLKKRISQAQKSCSDFFEFQDLLFERGLCLIELDTSAISKIMTLLKGLWVVCVQY